MSGMDKGVAIYWANSYAPTKYKEDWWSINGNILTAKCDMNLRVYIGYYDRGTDSTSVTVGVKKNNANAVVKTGSGTQSKIGEFSVKSGDTVETIRASNSGNVFITWVLVERY